MSKKHHHEKHAEPAAPDPAAQPAEAAAPQLPDELAAARAEIADWKSKYLYALAEAENIRKRALKERSELLQYAGKDVLYDLLDVADNFARALEADRAQTDPKVIVDGIELIYKQLMQVLEKHQVRPVEAMGMPFDPSVHEALQHVPTADAAPDMVIAELQRGYRLRDRVLRPARVAVAAPAPSDQAGPSAPSDQANQPSAPDA
mgnify:CR=1 FL=1